VSPHFLAGLFKENRLLAWVGKQMKTKGKRPDGERILITGSDNYHMTRVQAMMNSLMKDGKNRQQR